MLPWFALRTSRRWEFRASSELSLNGIETYLPTCRVKHHWSDRVKIVEEPLFPGYLFGRFHMDDRIRVLQTQGVKQIVSMGNIPAPVSDGEIESLRTLVFGSPVIVAWPYLSIGQKVRIDRGPLAGVEGFVVRAKEGELRIVVSVHLLQRSLSAEIDRDSIGSAGLVGVGA
jgi:transcription antitermination factor NusG